MSRKFRFYNFVLLITILVFQSAAQITPAPAQAQNSIKFSITEVENHFPDEMVFRVTVTSTGADIVSAKFAFTNENLYGSRSFTKDSIEFDSGPTVHLAYTMDTRDITTPPMMAYLYHWEVVDADGNKIQSEEVQIRYEDNRYNWQVLENEDISVWWHDRSETFGQTIFDIASDAVSYQQELFQEDLDFQIRIVISNSSEEFNSWHSLEHDWIGGQTFSNYGITNQIVEGEFYQDAWLNSVIPHEISHIFFNQVVYNPTVSVPVWLNEGVAQYNEFITHEWEMGLVETAAADRSLVPLSALENGFGSYDVDRIYLSYAEAYSAAAYLVQTYGNVGLSALLAAYKDGETTDDAFQTALGLSVDQFEIDWAGSVGAEDYLIPTVWAIPTFRPSPTAYILTEQGTPIPGQTSAGTPSPPSIEQDNIEKNDSSYSPFPLPAGIIIGITAIMGTGIVLLGYYLSIREARSAQERRMDLENGNKKAEG